MINKFYVLCNKTVFLVKNVGLKILSFGNNKNIFDIFTFKILNASACQHTSQANALIIFTNAY